MNSEPGNLLAAKFVVDAHSEQIDVSRQLLICKRYSCWTDVRDVFASHEEPVILERSRPVGSEAVFDAGSCCTAPTGLTHRAQNSATHRSDILVAVAGHRSTTIDIEEDVVAGVTKLTREEPKAAREGAIDPKPRMAPSMMAFIVSTS
jgi:hypothetical protein